MMKRPRTQLINWVLIILPLCLALAPSALVLGGGGFCDPAEGGCVNSSSSSSSGGSSSGFSNEKSSIGITATAANAVQLLEKSKLTGDAFLLDNAPTSVVSKSDSTWGGTIKRFDKTPDLAPVVVPTVVPGLVQYLPGCSDANPGLSLDGGDLNPNNDSVTLTGGPVIIEGKTYTKTYYAKSLSLANTSTLRTNGNPVDLYVEGPITVDNSYLYGQGAKDPRTTGDVKHYLAENFRIFAKSRTADGQTFDTITLKGTTGRTAAVFYAPDMNLVIKDGYWFQGAVVVKKASLERSNGVAIAQGAGGYALFDQRLLNDTFPFSPTLAKLVILLWGNKADGGSTSSPWIDTGNPSPNLTPPSCYDCTKGWCRATSCGSSSGGSSSGGPGM